MCKFRNENKFIRDSKIKNLAFEVTDCYICLFSTESSPSYISLESLDESETDVRINSSNPIENAQIYFQQSGILGQLKKTSKAFIAAKQDAINVEQV